MDTISVYVMEILDEGFKKKLEPDMAKIGLLKKEAEDQRKHIRNGKIALYLIMMFTVMGGFMGYFYAKNELIYVAIEILIYLLFYSIALYIFPEKPKNALIVTLVTYLFQVLVNAMLVEPGSIMSGFIAKIIFLYFVIKGIVAARNFEKIKMKLEEYGEYVHL